MFFISYVTTFYTISSYPGNDSLSPKDYLLPVMMCAVQDAKMADPCKPGTIAPGKAKPRLPCSDLLVLCYHLFSADCE